MAARLAEALQQDLVLRVDENQLGRGSRLPQALQLSRNPGQAVRGTARIDAQSELLIERRGADLQFLFELAEKGHGQIVDTVEA